MISFVPYASPVNASRFTCEVVPRFMGSVSCLRSRYPSFGNPLLNSLSLSTSLRLAAASPAETRLQAVDEVADDGQDEEQDDDNDRDDDVARHICGRA